ncbi:serine hydrolase domain-containing protein [Dactylosporangium sp. CA-233914]|uniref:serine hydrolase domain-containing protein n=1 Tax=Dactylosporangium sp. CA-233914 TaxID=3239934 RepID=UPI003D8D0AA9
MSKHVIRAALASTVALTALLVAPGTGHAEPAADYAAFLDETVPAQLAKYRIPGAAVVVVSGGQQVAVKGYGQADVSAGVPVVPDRTGFFIGSSAKMFTATAVMQLVEQGRLDLHADVNTYLDTFKIPDTFPGRPITLAHLLTHTSGFEDKILGVAVRDPADVGPLAEYVAKHRPERVRPPGELASYDNYGYTLAGYVVQVVSGQPFEQYVATHITQPLGMSGTTAAQPHPAAIETTMAHGYRPDGDGQVPARGQYGPLAPTGAGVVATATDMGRFLNAQLSAGAGLLNPASITQMQTRQFTHDPRLPGMAYGWEEHPRNGQRILSKDGDVPGFHSNLAILPDKGIGVFVVCNGDGVDGTGSYATKELVERFVDRFFRPAAGAPRAEATGSVAKYTGNYRVTRTGDDLTKAAVLVSSVSVEPGPDGALTTTGPLSADPDKTTQHWVRVDDDLFQERDGQDQLGFRLDDDGHVTALYTTANPTVAYERLAWWQSPALHQALLAVSLLVLVASVVYWPIAALVRRLRHHAAPSRWARAARLAAWTTAALVTAFTAVFAAAFADANKLNESIVVGTSPLLVTALALSTTAVGCTAVALVCAVVAWRRHWWTLPGRLHYTLVTLAAGTFLGIATSYHLAIA